MGTIVGLLQNYHQAELIGVSRLCHLPLYGSIFGFLSPSCIFSLAWKVKSKQSMATMVSLGHSINIV